jgi:hypothetical protein
MFNFRMKTSHGYEAWNKSSPTSGEENIRQSGRAWKYLLS